MLIIYLRVKIFNRKRDPYNSLILLMVYYLCDVINNYVSAANWSVVEEKGFLRIQITKYIISEFKTKCTLGTHNRVINFPNALDPVN